MKIRNAICQIALHLQRRRKMKRQILYIIILLCALFLAACQPEPTPTPPPTETAVPTEEPTAVPTAEPTEEPTATPTPAPATITGILWQWQEFQDSAEQNNITVESPENYTIVFNEDGTYNGQVDCNRVTGSYTLDGSSLTIEPGASTLAFCGEESLDVQYLMFLESVVSFVMDGENLVLNLTADAGNMVFINGGEPEAVPAVAQVTGNVVYEEDIPLPDDAILMVQILDMSLQDVAAILIGEQSYATEGAQIPLPFAVEYDPALIQEERNYSLGVYINNAAGDLLFINDTNIPIINNGVTSDIEAVVVPVAETGAAAGIKPSQISLDTQGLPYSWQANEIAATPYDQSQPPGPMGLPQHIVVNFGVQDPADRQPTDPILYIIPVDEYVAEWEANDNDYVTRSIAAIYDLTKALPSPAPTSGLPALPPEAPVVGFNDVAVQVAFATPPDEQTDTMATKNGFRFVGRWAQDANPVTNQGLRYVYQGFTNDGKYLVTFFYPVSTPALPNSVEDLSQADWDAFNADPQAAIQAQTQMLNGLATADWEPDLATLDALVQSLQIEDMAANGLVNQTWQWTGIVTNPSTAVTTTSELAGPYSVTFNPDGTAAIEADCNNAIMPTTIIGGLVGGILFEPGPMTLVACPPESQSDAYLSLFAASQNYRVHPGGHRMELIMPAAGGDWLFVNQEAQALETIAGLPAELMGKPWQWVSFSDAATGPTDIAEPERYQIQLEADGTILIQADCNSGSGIFSVNESSISIIPGPMTRAACPEDSQDAAFLQYLSAAVIWFTQEGDLFFDLFADSGTMRFAAADEELTAEAPESESSDTIPPDAIQIDVTGLAETYSWEVRDSIPPSPVGAGMPAHIIVTFDGETADDAIANGGRYLYIFPVETYQNVGGQPVIDQLTRLTELISASEGTTPESPMPLLPPPSSFMDRWVQFANLDFVNGMGVRYVSEAPNRQAIGPWVNLGTAYYFQGLTEDGRFYLSLHWPVSTAALPNTPADVPADVEAQATNPETYPVYLQETKDTLNGLDTADWTPDLADLDALVASISFQR
jgi:heat shock protein HslJ/uncharacterized lipoprotein YbaY